LLSFKACINNFYGLAWELTEPSQKFDFMDISISFIKNKFHFTLFKKVKLVPLYPSPIILPPGVLTGLICSNILCIYQLCSLQDNI
jgi:hypothetical protein